MEVGVLKEELELSQMKANGLYESGSQSNVLDPRIQASKFAGFDVESSMSWLNIAGKLCLLLHA